MKSITLFLAAFLAGSGPLVAQGPSAVWATDSSAPCAGLTVGWHVPAAKLQAVVGSRGAVAADSTGSGLVLLFVTTCPESTIDGHPTGPTALGVAIVRLAPRVDPSAAPGTRWSAVPLAYGSAGAPVTGLFRRFGYRMAFGPVSLHVDTTGGPQHVSFVIETAAGRVEATAAIADSVSHYALTGALIGTDSLHPGMFAGPEWALRRMGTATVRATGETLLSRLGITAAPDVVAYDTGFGWRFTFSSAR